MDWIFLYSNGYAIFEGLGLRVQGSNLGFRV